MLKKQATTRDYHERNRRVAAFRVGDFFAARVVRLRALTGVGTSIAFGSRMCDPVA